MARAVAAQAAKLEEKARRIKTLEKLALSAGDADAIAELKRRRRTTGNVLRDEREKPPRASLDAVGALCRRAEAAEAALKQTASDGSVPASPRASNRVTGDAHHQNRRGAREDDRGRAGARAARAEAALADDGDARDRCAAAEVRAARAEADAAERAARADRAEAALAASRGAAADAAQAAAALADDAAGFTQRVSKIVDGARDACADGLVEGALSAARLSSAREGAGADAVEAIDARRDATPRRRPGATPRWRPGARPRRRNVETPRRTRRRAPRRNYDGSRPNNTRTSARSSARPCATSRARSGRSAPTSAKTTTPTTCDCNCGSSSAL